MDDTELAKMMNNPYYFFDENLKNGFKSNLESHNISHAISFCLLHLMLQNLGLNSDILIQS